MGAGHSHTPQGHPEADAPGARRPEEGQPDPGGHPYPADPADRRRDGAAVALGQQGRHHAGQPLRGRTRASRFDTGKIQRVVVGSCMDGSGPGADAAGAPADSAQGAAPGQGSQCTFAYTEPDKGGNPVKVVINPDVAKSHGVKIGDNIRYLNLSKAQGASAQGSPAYVFVDFVRTLPIVLLAILYAVVVIAVARWRGLRALIGLVGAYTVLVTFILPGPGRRETAAAAGARRLHSDHDRRAVLRPRLHRPDLDGAAGHHVRAGHHRRCWRPGPPTRQTSPASATMTPPPWPTSLTTSPSPGSSCAGSSFPGSACSTTSPSPSPPRCGNSGSWPPGPRHGSSSARPCGSAGTTSPPPSTPSRSPTPAPHCPS